MGTTQIGICLTILTTTSSFLAASLLVRGVKNLPGLDLSWCEFSLWVKIPNWPWAILFWQEKLKNLGFLDLGYEYVVVDDCCMAITQGKKAQACPRLKACPLAHVVYAHGQVCIQLHIDAVIMYNMAQPWACSWREFLTNAAGVFLETAISCCLYSCRLPTYGFCTL